MHVLLIHAEPPPSQTRDRQQPSALTSQLAAQTREQSVRAQSVVDASKPTDAAAVQTEGGEQERTERANEGGAKETNTESDDEGDEVSQLFDAWVTGSVGGRGQKSIGVSPDRHTGSASDQRVQLSSPAKAQQQQQQQGPTNAQQTPAKAQQQDSSTSDSQAQTQQQTESSTINTQGQTQPVYGGVLYPPGHAEGPQETDGQQQAPDNTAPFVTNDVHAPQQQGQQPQQKEQQQQQQQKQGQQPQQQSSQQHSEAPPHTHGPVPWLLALQPCPPLHASMRALCVGSSQAGEQQQHASGDSKGYASPAQVRIIV